MEYKYNPPPEEKKRQVDRRFLPSMAFTVLHNLDEEELPHSLSAIACRRFPQVVRMMIDRGNCFNTHLVIPVEKSPEKMEFLDMDDGPFWEKQMFLPPVHGLDYIIGGGFSFRDRVFQARIYSVIDREIIYSQDYASDTGCLELAGSFAEDLMLIMDRGKTPRACPRDLPVSHEEALAELLQALDYDPANRVYPEGHQLFLESLKKCLALDPESDLVSEILSDVAGNIFLTREMDKSMEIVDYVLSLRPGDFDANRLKTRILVKKDRTAEALTRLIRLQGQGMEMGDVAFDLGRELMETSLVEPAQQLLETAVALECREPALYDCLGFLFVSMKQQEKALEIMMEGLDLFPGREYALVTTAQLLADLGRAREAKIAYDTALNLFPDSAMLHVSCGIHLFRAGQGDAAIRMVNQALELAPEDPLVNMEASRFFNRMDRKDVAVRYARTAMELTTNPYLTSEAQELLSRIQGGILPQQQASNRNLFIQARQLLDDDNEDKALEILEKVTEVEPAFWKAQFLKGVIYRKKNRLSEALETFTGIDELFSDQVSLHHEIGRCLMGQEKFADAFPHLFYAFRKKPQDPVIMANMGLVYLFTGKVNEAEVLLLQAKRMSRDISLNLDPYIREVQRIKKRKESGRGNGGVTKRSDTFDGNTSGTSQGDSDPDNEPGDPAGEENWDEPDELGDSEDSGDSGDDMPRFPGLN